jgi:hypothetical protein
MCAQLGQPTYERLQVSARNRRLKRRIGSPAVLPLYMIASVNTGPKRNLIGPAHNHITFL